MGFLNEYFFFHLACLYSEPFLLCSTDRWYISPAYTTLRSSNGAFPMRIETTPALRSLYDLLMIALNLESSMIPRYLIDFLVLIVIEVEMVKIGFHHYLLTLGRRRLRTRISFLPLLRMSWWSFRLKSML